MNKIRITDYLNFREFLRDIFQYLRMVDPGFSQKRIHLELGITSTGFLSNVLAGRKNLVNGQIAKISRLIGLDRNEAAYFENLVNYTQCRIATEKQLYFDVLMNMQSVRLKQLHEHTLTLFSKWYYVAIREVLEIMDWYEDETLLAKSLQPEIKIAEVHDALEVLTELGLISKDAKGRVKPCDKAISTGENLFSAHLMQFQGTTLDLAKQALYEVSPKERDVSVLTASLSEESYELVKNEIRLLRKKIAKISLDDNKRSRVFQMNFQLFPLSKKVK